MQMFSRLGDDAFGRLARENVWAADGIDASLTTENCGTPTGSAVIFLIDEVSGENAIIVVPGACFTLRPEDVEAAGEAIRGAGVLLTQLELPLDTVACGLRLAREAGVRTILNPALPAQSLSDEVLGLADFLIPNESEAALLTGLPVESVAQAEAAAGVLMGRGCEVRDCDAGGEGGAGVRRGGSGEVGGGVSGGGGAGYHGGGGWVLRRICGGVE